ncbi:hypothetical protein PILCRDRAFT_739740 [Piloderma croceum F 1598]|uniref:Uncharacterized protein n=1 Tax=Piloderma croceum (strain F 1598) TaxID=765440 RepID=A0A0C3AFL6_PILCF|nr:hypothetical protein PILCRDRAFT_739740 [Piloderma croceum F 1598]
MTIWGEYIVVVRPYDVQLFSRPSSSPPRLLRAFEFSRFAWEAVIVDSSALKKSMEGVFPRNFSENTDSVISFILTHQHDAFLYVIETDVSLNGKSPHDNLSMRLAKTYGLTHGWMNPAWHLCAGITGKRITWISGGIQLNVDPPILCSSVLNLEEPGICFDDSGSLFEAEIEISDTEKFPALWAFPQFDFDEALGLLVVGNVFGELAVCDYVGRWSNDLLLLAEDISAADAPSFLRLPDTPVPMDISTIVHESPDDDFPDPATLGNVYASWNTVAETGARIPPTWSNDWSNLGPRHMLRWQGTPGDRAWFLEHAFHFLGRPEPILYRDPERGDLVLFQAGGLHFILGDDGEEDIHVYSDGLTLPDILGHESMMWPNTVKDVNWTADRERGQFELLLRGEARTKGRNRWIEQKERGGSPPVSYLTVPQIKTSSFELRPLTPDSDIEDVPVKYC